jgi:hypothetical protein
MRRLVIQFVEMHCTRMRQIFIDLHPGYKCDLFIELFTNRHMSAIKKKLTAVFLFQLLQFDYEVCVVLDQNCGNVMFCKLVANLQSMFPS